MIIKTVLDILIIITLSGVFFEYERVRQGY